MLRTEQEEEKREKNPPRVAATPLSFPLSSSLCSIDLLCMFSALVGLLKSVTNVPGASECVFSRAPFATARVR